MNLLHVPSIGFAAVSRLKGGSPARGQVTAVVHLRGRMGVSLRKWKIKLQML